MSTDPSTTYNAMAEDYAKKSDKGAWNALYERPNTLSLIPDVEGKKVLDLGCGAGPITQWLADHGAHVVGVDISENMLAIARQRLGERAQFYHADFGKPLEFVANGSIDVIVASLSLHYVEDWDTMFAGFAKMLTPDGYVIFSTHQPHEDWRWHQRPNYFVTEIYEETWDVEGTPRPVRFYHRSLGEMFRVFKTAGFYVDELLEPFPLPAMEQADPKGYAKLMKEPWFLFLRLRKH